MSVMPEEIASALREAGYNPDEFAPANTPAAQQAGDLKRTPAAVTPAVSTPELFGAKSPDFWARGHGIQPPPKRATGDPVLSLGYSGQQIDYAIRQNQNPSAQFNMYARMNDIRRMAEVAKNHSGMSPEELDATASRLDMPPGLVEMMKEQYPDELERRKLYAQMVEVSGPDSYFATRFSNDPQYQAYMRGHEMEFANIQAAVKNVYASSAEIALGWGWDAVKSAFVETVHGIPAGLSQVARDVRDATSDWKPQEEIPLTDDMTPEERVYVEGMNLRTREANASMAELLADPETQAQAANNREFLNSMDDWLQNTYQDETAAAYGGDTRTGNWILDDLAKPAIEAVPSVATSVVEAVALSPAAPLIHFGLQAQTSSYREMRDEGIGLETALPLSIGRGIFEGAVEQAQVGNILKGVGARKILGGLLGPSVSLRSRLARTGGHIAGAVGNSLSNAAQEIVQGAAEKGVTPLAKAISLGDPYSNVFSAIYEGRNDLLREGWGVIPITLLTGGMFGNVAGEVSDMRKYNAFQRAAAPLAAAGDTAIKNGKSVAEARQEVRAMVHEAVANGGGMGTTVYADSGDVESYLQGKPREAAEKALAAIGVTPEAFQQAQADKTDIEIPIENLAVQEGGSDPEFLKLFRPTPNMATATAIAQKTAETTSVYDMARELRKLLNDDVEGKVVPEFVRVFRQDLKTRLNWKAEEADFTASLLWSQMKTTAERNGIELDELAATSFGGNVRVAMDGWIRQNEAWLRGVREQMPTVEMEEYDDAENDASAVFDPALGEDALDIPEQPGDGSDNLSGTEPGTAAQPVDTGSGRTVGQPVEPQAAVPHRALFSPPPAIVRPGEYADQLTGLPFAMETVSTAGIKTDPGAFQFKRDADAETGVKKGQEIPGDVNPAALGTMVLYEDVDGDRFVVSGHHRLDLLRRKGEEADVRAGILKENDGWSTDHARVYGAALNIQEGGGDTDDYAAFFRETRDSMPREKAEAEGLLRRDNARIGYAIGALGGDNTYYGFINGEMSARQAAAIANAAPNDSAIQDMMIVRKIPAAEMETFAGYVRKMRNSGALNLDGVQLSLFSGKDHSAMLAAMEKESKIAAKKASELEKKASSLDNLMKAGKTLSTAELRKHGARAGDREGLRLEAEELRVEADRWRKFFQNPDILAQVQEEAGTAVKPESFTQAAAEPFGEAFTEYSGKPQEAIEHLLKERRGHVPQAFHKEGLGDIDLPWGRGGERGYGLSHIIERRNQDGIDGEKFVRTLPEIIENGEVIQEEGKPVAFIHDGNSKAIIRLDWDGVKRTWLVTAYPQKQQAPGGLQSLPGVSSTSRIPPSNLSDGSISSTDGVVNPDETFNQDVRRVERGKVDLYRADATHRQAAVIRVMKGADMSTVLHELAHIFLADMRDYVDANREAAKANGTAGDYIKLSNAAGDLSQTENIEQIARWFEEYLREGRAPSVELAKPFGLFSKWLTNVYGNIRHYVGREMNAETRGVFDRWLASEREIAEAEAYYGGLHSTDFINLIDDDDKRKELEEQLEQRRQRIQSRYAGEMAKAWTQANTSHDGLAKEAEREVSGIPVYRALAAAKRSGLDRAAAEKSVGQKTVLKIVDAHGNVFAGGAAIADPESILRKAGYHEADPLDLFLKELSESDTWDEAVKKAPASHVNRRRHFLALDAIRSGGGIDAESLTFLPDIDVAGLERHDGLFRPDGRENLDRIAMEAGFRNPSEMLEAMAKAPRLEDAAQRLTEQKVVAQAREARVWATESLTEIMDDTPPAGQSAFHDPDEDIMAEGIELQRDAIRQAIEARTNRRQAYMDRRALADKAKRFLFSQKNRDAMNYNNYAASERRWSAAAAEAMAKGDREAALTALDKQQEFHALSTEAFRIRRDFADFTRRYGQRMARSELASVESEYRDAVRDILVWSGVVVDKSGRFAPENSDPDRLILPHENPDDKSLRDEFDAPRKDDTNESIEYFAPSLETLIPEWIRLKKLPKGYAGNVLDLTPAMLADIDASIKTLIKYGRGELQALEEKDNQNIADLRDKLMAVMETLPEKKQLSDKKRLDRMQSSMADFLAGNLGIDALADEVDGFALHAGKEMGLMMRMVGKIREGETKQMEFVQKFKEATEEDFRTFDAFVARLKKENGGTFFNVDGVPSPAELTDGVIADTEWDSEMILSLMFNAGNRGNLYALQNGFGLTDAELDKLFSLATESEWLAIQHVAKEMGKLFEPMDAVHYRMTNRHLEQVRPEKLTVQTADGKMLELDGWYFPLVFDPGLSDRAGKNAEAAEYRAVMGAIFNPQKLKDGFTNSRQVDEDGNPVVTYAPLLSTKVIVEHMTTATRWIFLAEPLMEFRRVTMDPEFRKMFIRKIGKERYRDLRMWTNRMARPDKGIDEGINRLIRKARNASTVSALGLNLRSAMMQVSSTGLAADAMSKASGTGKTGWHFMWRGLRKIGARGAMSKLLSPLGFKSEATEEMFRLSPEAKHRAGNVNKDVRAALDAFSPTSGKVARNWAKVKEWLFHFTISVDHLVSGAAFWGAYEQASTGNAGFDIKGLSQEEVQKKAVEYANYIVRTQQSPYQADYTRLQADNGVISLATQFMGGLTPYLNNTYINVQLARRMGWKGTRPLATHLLNAYVLPSVALSAISREVWGRLTGDEDEEEGTLAGDLAENVIGQLTGGLPLVRDASRWAVRSARTGNAYDSAFRLPVTEFPNRILGKARSAVENLAEGEAYAAGKDMGMAAAEILGVSAPIRQLRPLAENMGLVEEE